MDEVANRRRDRWRTEDLFFGAERVSDGTEDMSVGDDGDDAIVLSFPPVRSDFLFGVVLFFNFILSLFVRAPRSCNRYWPVVLIMNWRDPIDANRDILT